MAIAPFRAELNKQSSWKLTGNFSGEEIPCFNIGSFPSKLISNYWIFLFLLFPPSFRFFWGGWWNQNPKELKVLLSSSKQHRKIRSWTEWWERPSKGGNFMGRQWWWRKAAWQGGLQQAAGGSQFWWLRACESSEWDVRSLLALFPFADTPV